MLARLKKINLKVQIFLKKLSRIKVKKSITNQNIKKGSLKSFKKINCF